MADLTRASGPEYRFGPFQLNPAERQLLRDGNVVALGPRAFDLLVLLVQRAGQLVGKEEILRLVWPGLVVEENNLQVQVSALRKVLGHDAIATIPSLGYRFVAAPDRPPTERAGRHGPPPLSVIVMPFGLSGKGEAGDLA